MGKTRKPTDVFSASAPAWVVAHRIERVPDTPVHMTYEKETQPHAHLQLAEQGAVARHHRTRGINGEGGAGRHLSHSGAEAAQQLRARGGSRPAAIRRQPKGHSSRCAVAG